MDKTLLEEAKKHRVAIQELATVYLPASQWDDGSAKKWVEVIQKFLADHNLNDAKIRISMEGYDGYLEHIAVQEMVYRTEEAIRKDIETVQERAAAEKKAKQEAAKKKLEQEKATYERLKKKFDKPKKKNSN